MILKDAPDEKGSRCAMTYSFSNSRLPCSVDDLERGEVFIRQLETLSISLAVAALLARMYVDVIVED